MAKIETIYLNGSTLKLNVALRPKGNVWLEVPLPEAFADCIWKLAQAAADENEQFMRAEIVGESHDR